MISINGTKIELGHFPDGTLLVKYSAFRKTYEITWKYESDAELFALICITKHIRSLYPTVMISLFMPYVPHARMDRVKDDHDIFTLKYFAEVINSLNFYEVEVLDPHSYVSEALIDRISSVCPIEYIDKACNSIYELEEDPNCDILYFYPDSGAVRRYHYKGINAYGEKDRDWKTGNILGLRVIGNVKPGQPVLIIDDICSKGGTFYYAARKLKELGAGNIYLYVTHCENTILEGDLIKSDLIKKIYTTDSIFTKEHPLIEVMKL